VTQQLIDETRLAPENAMLSDMQNVVNVGGDIHLHRGPHGETPVRHAASRHQHCNLTFYSILCSSIAFSALTLLVGRQEGHPACKN